MATASEQIPQIFDADNHYWETSDAFTRHRDPEFADRGVRLVEVDGQARYVFDGGRLHPDHPRSRRRAHAPAARRAPRLLRGHERQGPARRRTGLRGSDRASRWFDRDARLRCMDEQGVEAGLAVPVAGCVHGGPDAARHRSVDPHPRGRSTGGSRRTGASPTRTGSSQCRT